MAEFKPNYYCSNYLGKSQFIDPDVSCWITYVHPVHKIWMKTDSNEGIKPFHDLNLFEYTPKTFNQNATQDVQQGKVVNESEVYSDINFKSTTTVSQNMLNPSIPADVKRTENCLDLYVKMVELKVNNRLSKCKTVYQLRRLNGKEINRRDHDWKILRKSSRLQQKRKNRVEETYKMNLSGDKKLLKSKKVSKIINKSHPSLSDQDTTTLSIPKTRIPNRIDNKENSVFNFTKSLHTSKIKHRNKSNCIKGSSIVYSGTRATDSFLRQEKNDYVSGDVLFNTKTSEPVKKMSGVLYRVTPIYSHSYSLRPLESRILRYPLFLEKLQ
uniref:Uncharacterized protein n=1 Tax=Cuerna arida TaxID=1464854 RepID=A0A1B6GI95_9HEMI